MTFSFKVKLYSLIGLAVMFQGQAHALQSSQLEKFYQNYKKGNYQKAIEVLERKESEKNNEEIKSYLLGLSYSRLQEYDKAIKYFEIAIKEKNQNIDIQYE